MRVEYLQKKQGFKGTPKPNPGPSQNDIEEHKKIDLVSNNSSKDGKVGFFLLLGMKLHIPLGLMNTGENVCFCHIGLIFVASV